MTLIDSLNSLQNLHSIAPLLGRADQCLHILREARATITATGIEELRANAHIGTDTLAHHIDIGTHDLAQIGNVVHKRDARCQHRIGRILDHLGRRHIGEDHTIVVHHKGLIQTLHQLSCTLALDTYNHAVGLHKVVDRIALLQKLGIRRHIELNLHATCRKLLTHSLLNLLSRTNGNGTLGYQQRIAIDLATELARHFKNIAQVGTAIFIRRRTHCAKNYLDIIKTLAQLSRKTQTAIGHIARYQLFESRFIYRNLTRAKHLNLTFIYIYAGHIGTHLGKTSSRYQTNVTRTYDCYLHT